MASNPPVPAGGTTASPAPLTASPVVAPASPVVAPASPARPALPRLERSDLRAAFWRYFWSFQISWNYERMQALGFAYAMEPVLRKLFPKSEDYEAALKRHLVFFNTNPVIGAPLIIGSAIAMEEAGAPASAEGVKVALMGPLAGVGDTIVWALYNSIIFTIGASMALSQNILGPIFVIVMVAVPYTLVRWWQFFWAYEQGKALATSLGSGALERVTEGATILGLIVIGGFIPSIVHRGGLQAGRDGGRQDGHPDRRGPAAAGHDPAVHAADHPDRVRLLAAQAVQPQPALGDRDRLRVRYPGRLAGLVRTDPAGTASLIGPRTRSAHSGVAWRLAPPLR
jgi:mannose/fructose/N-acetylgalactosamine-specific phosphotransferase system component IID